MGNFNFTEIVREIFINIAEAIIGPADTEFWLLLGQVLGELRHIFF